MKLLISILTLSTLLVAQIRLPQNFKTNFFQTITNEKGKVIKYEGEVHFKNLEQLFTNMMGEEESYTRSLFKWSYTSPTKKEVCTDGTQVIVVDHDLEQVANYMIEDSINLKEILTIANRISAKDYQATYKEIEYLITLDEKEQLKQIVYVDNLENRVKIIFKGMHYDTIIKDEILECHAPKDYDRIKG